MDDELPDDEVHGVGAHHPGRETQPFVVAPTTENAFNVLSVDLVAVACLKLEDLLFEFDSSFPNVKTAKMLAQLPALREAHRNDTGQAPPLSIFGHADPVGTDDYNKQLSGRRAIAIFAVLTRDLALWNFLFDTPAGGDNWKANHFQETMRKALGAPAGQSRDALSQAYMALLCPFTLAKSDFLGKGADPKGKADFQGCSEFNPLVVLSEKENKTLSHAKRNEENATNRRVLIFLFRPATRINVGQWPCPTALAGTADCFKRFFGPPRTGNERRKPGAERRSFAETADTFGCRFYDRLSKLSPCENPVPPPVIRDVNPLIFFVGGEPIVADTVRSGLPTAPPAAGEVTTASLVSSANVGAIGIAQDIVLVKKPYTHPRRVAVVLKTDKPFDGRGELTVNDKEKIRFFPTSNGKKHLEFSGDNVFTGAQLDPTGPGVTLFAEGHKVSGSMRDVVLTLRLFGGTKKPGPNAVGRMTSVELTLDICEPRLNATTEPAALPQAPEAPAASPADKFFLGRPIPIQDEAKIQERAKLIVRPVQPSGFTALGKKLVLVRIGPNVTTFADEDPKTSGVIPPRHVFAPSDKDIAFFVEGGPDEHTKARQANYQLGVEGVDGDGDRVSVTVVLAEIISNRKPSDVKTVARVPETPERKTRSIFFPAPIIIGRHFPIELRAFVLVASPSAHQWTVQGGAPLTLTDTDKAVLKLRATNISAAENDTLLQVRLTTDFGVFLRRHRLTAVQVTIDPVSANHVFTDTSPVNTIKNPATLVILTGSDANDAAKVAQVEMVTFGRFTRGATATAPGTTTPDTLGIVPNLTWTVDDPRIAWWIIGDDGGEYRGKADFRNTDASKRGTQIEVVGGSEGDVLIQPYSGGFGYGMFRATVLPLRKVKYRINRIFTKTVAPVPPSPGKPGKPGRAAHQPTRSHADAVRHIAIANIFLRQAGIELVPDTSTEKGAPKPGNAQIGLAALDGFIVAVTDGTGATGTVLPGHFDVEVNTVSLTFRASDVRSSQAIQINARNEIITMAYVESLVANDAVAQANLIPTNHTPALLLKDKGTPSSSLIVRSGIPDQVPVTEVRMRVGVSIGVGAQPATPAGGARSRNLLWGLVVPTRTSDAVNVPGGMTQDLLYGSTLAHEVCHVLGLDHRTTIPPFADGLRTPRDKNLMFAGTTRNMENLDIVQIKAIRNSEVLRRNP